MKDFSVETVMLSEDEYVDFVKIGLDTKIEIVNDGDHAQARLSWVQAQQLFRWLKERLGE